MATKLVTIFTGTSVSADNKKALALDRSYHELVGERRDPKVVKEELEAIAKKHKIDLGTFVLKPRAFYNRDGLRRGRK